MFKNFHFQEITLSKYSLILSLLTSLIVAFVALLFNENLCHIGKTLSLLIALVLSFGGMLLFLNSCLRCWCFFGFIANIIFAITLLWIRQTYNPSSDLALLLNIIAYCSLGFALLLRNPVLIGEGIAFCYIALFYALFDFSDTYLAFIILLVLGFYLAWKTPTRYSKIINFLNLFYFFFLVLFFKQALWLIPLWIMVCMLFLSHKFAPFSNAITDRLTLLSLCLLVIFFESSNIFISETLQEGWVWIFALITFAFWLWIEEMKFVCIFILLFICALVIEPYLLGQDALYLYYWLLFFIIWFEVILRWMGFGLALLCLFACFQYLSIQEDLSSLGLFLIICGITFFTTIIMRSKNAI